MSIGTFQYPAPGNEPVLTYAPGTKERETLKKRLKVYHQQTAPILPYYRAHGILRSVDASAEMDAVARRIEGILG